MERIIGFLIVLVIGSSCSSDDGSSSNARWIRGVEGTVISTESCHAADNSLAYRVDISTEEPLPWIIASNLPENFRPEGSKIKFDMLNSSEGFGACTANFSPEIFYKLDHVKVIESK